MRLPGAPNGGALYFFNSLLASDLLLDLLRGHDKRLEVALPALPDEKDPEDAEKGATHREGPSVPGPAKDIPPTGSRPGHARPDADQAQDEGDREDDALERRHVPPVQEQRSAHQEPEDPGVGRDHPHDGDPGKVALRVPGLRLRIRMSHFLENSPCHVEEEKPPDDAHPPEGVRREARKDEHGGEEHDGFRGQRDGRSGESLTQAPLQCRGRHEGEVGAGKEAGNDTYGNAEDK